MKQAEKRMDAAVEHLRNTFRGISTGRARTGLLEHVRVEAYGQTYPLHHLACVTGDGARRLRVSPFDPSLVGAIRKGILAANLGLNPQVGGTTLVVPIPSLDDDQRVRLCKRAKSLAEEQRVAVRMIRKDTRHQAQREGKLDKVKKRVESLTKERISEIDTLLEGKLGAINWKDPDWNCPT